jgi:hypothetical protein
VGAAEVGAEVVAGEADMLHPAATEDIANSPKEKAKRRSKDMERRFSLYVCSGSRSG